MAQATEVKIYFWTGDTPDYLLGQIPKSREEFDRNYKELPVTLHSWKSGVNKVLDDVFIELNFDQRNPLTLPSKQDWLRENMIHPHTSMSVGDVAKMNNKYYICLPSGWAEIHLVG
jgi:hypothetical protein